MRVAFVFFNGARREFPLLLSETSPFNVLHIFFLLHKRTTLSFWKPRKNKTFYVSWENNGKTIQRLVLVYIAFDTFSPQRKLFVIVSVGCLRFFTITTLLSFLLALFIFSRFPSQSVLELIDIIALRGLQSMSTVSRVKFVFKQLEMFSNAYCYQPFGTKKDFK